MNQSYLDRLSYDSAESQIPYDDGLNLNESSCHVIPDVDQIKNGVSNELTKVWVWFETTR